MLYRTLYAADTADAPHRLLTVCSGTLLAARAGLLAGRRERLLQRSCHSRAKAQVDAFGESGGTEANWLRRKHDDAREQLGEVFVLTHAFQGIEIP